MKRCLSLLEVVIGLALTMILLSSLFSSYRDLVQNSAKVQEQRKEMQGEFVMQLRLNQIFETLQEGSIFYTASDGLHFKFNNGIDPDPLYSGEMEGVLGKTLDGISLTLKEMRKEIFLKNIKKFEILFYHPKKTEWVNEWRGNILPPMIKLVIEKKEFVFFVPRAASEVKYS